MSLLSPPPPSKVHPEQLDLDVIRERLEPGSPSVPGRGTQPPSLPLALTRVVERLSLRTGSRGRGEEALEQVHLVNVAPLLALKPVEIVRTAAHPVTVDVDGDHEVVLAARGRSKLGAGAAEHDPVLLDAVPLLASQPPRLLVDDEPLVFGPARSPRGQEVALEVHPVQDHPVFEALPGQVADKPGTHLAPAGQSQDREEREEESPGHVENLTPFSLSLFYRGSSF